MFNVIPPISSRKVSFTPQNNRYSSAPNNLAPLKADTTSFTGATQFKFDDLYKICRANKFSLSKTTISRALEESDSENVMLVLSEKIGDVLAKRMNHSKYTSNTIFGSSIHTIAENTPKVLVLHERANPREIQHVDWTNEYNEIKKVVSGYEVDANKTTEQLFELLQEYNLMK